MAAVESDDGAAAFLAALRENDIMWSERNALPERFDLSAFPHCMGMTQNNSKSENGGLSIAYFFIRAVLLLEKRAGIL